MNQLRAVYGMLSPIERMNIENKWGNIYNPELLLEAYFKQLGDINKQALIHLTAYTEAQMIGKAITNVEQCRLFLMTLLEWDGFDPENKDWANLKAYFGEAYQLLITSGHVKIMSGIIANA